MTWQILVMMIIAFSPLIFIIRMVLNVENSKKSKAKKDLVKFVMNLKLFNDYLVSNPKKDNEIRHTKSLPINKNELLEQSLRYISKLNEDFKEAVLITVPRLAFYRDDVPENGYIHIYEELNNLGISEIAGKIENMSEEERSKIDFSSGEMKEIWEVIDKNGILDFPHDLLSECEREQLEIYNRLLLKLNKPMLYKNL